MNRHELMTRVETELQSAAWSNPAHRDALRRRLSRAAVTPAPTKLLHRHRLVAALVALAVLVVAAGAAYRWREVFFLRGRIADEPTTFALPVDADGNVRLIFTDESGEAHEILVRPEDVDANGVIRGMEWSLDGPALGRSTDPEPQE